MSKLQRTIRRTLRRLGSWTRTRQDEQRMRSEVEEHIALQTADNVRAGLSPGEARRQAVLKFGAVETMVEGYRDQRGMPFVETLAQDTRHAIRRLRKSPGSTVTTVLTLALGIGATTSIFTLVHAIIYKSLAVAKPDDLYRAGKESRCCYWGGYSQQNEFSLFSYDLYKHLRNNTKGFAELAAFEAGKVLFGVRRAGGSDPAQSYPGEFVSGNYFTMFGVGAYAGRLLAAADDRPGAPPVAVMSYRLWRERYGSNPAIIGSVFNIDQKPFTVVGITPAAFFGDSLRNAPPDFFVPLNTEPLVEGDDDLNTVDNHWLDLIGRIRSGTKPESVEAQMRVELKHWIRSHWGEMSANERAEFPQQTLFLRPGGAGITSMREEYEHWLQVLMMVSGFVLLIVCANVANLMLVRGIEQRRQTSLSMALGAQPWRLVRRPLIESILLSLLGGAAGLAVAFAGTRLILHFAFPPIGGMAGVPIDASPSVPVLLFAFITSVMTGIAFGIAPAWIATRADPIEALRGASRSTTRTGSLPRKMLVVFQATFSLVLLSVSGLLTVALHKLENQNFGFAEDRRTVATINARLAGYGGEQLEPLYQRIHDSLAGIPGVSGVALCTYSPLNGNEWGAAVWINGRPSPGPGENTFASYDRVSAGYFDVIGNPILRGRGIGEQDTADSMHVAVVNEAFARRFFKNEDPIGKYFGNMNSGTNRQYEVIGVAKDARYLTARLDKPIEPFYFLPATQHDLFASGNGKEVDPGSHFLSDIAIVNRAGANPPVTQLRQALVAVDPNLPIISIRPLSEQVLSQFRQQRLAARITSFFGVLSLVLASIGLYGVTAYNVQGRTSEIGVRMALGAGRGDVLALILRGAFALIVFGLIIGLPLTLEAGRILSNQLYGMSPYNPVVLSAAVLTLGLCALVASLVPALRASLISPLEALRAE